MPHFHQQSEQHLESLSEQRGVPDSCCVAEQAAHLLEEIHDKLSNFEIAQVEVNGPDTHPVFKFLKDHTPLGHGGGADIEWNFAKWVVNKKGYPVVSAPAPKQEILVCAEASPPSHPVQLRVRAMLHTPKTFDVC